MLFRGKLPVGAVEKIWKIVRICLRKFPVSKADGNGQKSHPALSFAEGYPLFQRGGGGITAVGGRDVPVERLPWRRRGMAEACCGSVKWSSNSFKSIHDPKAKSSFSEH